MSSRPMPYLNSAPGSSSTLTAGRALPTTSTSPMPSSCDSRCCSTLEAMSYICPAVRVVEVIASTMIGASAGLILW